jgi:carboxymethylenebutenolidase
MNNPTSIVLTAILAIASGLSCAETNREGGPGEIGHLSVTYEKPLDVFVAGPEQAKHGILLIPGWMGLNERARELTRQFASAGYRAMAIDLYDGQVPNNPHQARLLMDAVEQEEANAKYRAALTALRAGGREIAVIGWSFGGSQALHATLAAPDLVSATVSYYPYGDMPVDPQTLKQLKGPWMIHVGDHDFALTADRISAVEQAMTSAAKTLVVEIYPARHSFDRASSANYNRIADEQARFSTSKFLDRYLN